MDGMRICGVSDQMGAEQVCAFPRNPNGPVRLGWYMTGLLPGWQELQQFEAIREAWSYWEAVCGIQASYYESSSACLNDHVAGKLEGIVAINTVHLDGPSGVLADSYLPCGTVRIRQRYDTGERWVNMAMPAGGIDLVRVAAHELGHAIGLPHISSGNLLQPTYSTTIRKPKGGDIAEAVKRYGLRREQPAPPPVIPTPAPGGGGMGGFLDLLKKIGPILDLLKDPRFLELIDLIVALFGNKQALSADDVDALAAQLTAKAQQMRAP